MSVYYNNASYVLTTICGDNNVSDNTERVLFAWYQLTVQFLLPVIAIGYCYVVVTRVLWTSAREHAQLTHSDR